MKLSTKLALIGLITLLSSAPANAEIDLDNDGLSDIWQKLYAVADSPDVDTDGDGQSNLNEAKAGTDPHDPQSVFAILGCDWSGASNAVCIRWRALHGKTYLIERLCEIDLAGAHWKELGRYDHDSIEEIVELSIADVMCDQQPNSLQGYIRLRVVDRDEDGDGISAWEENIVGADDTLGDDRQTVTDWLASDSKDSQESNPLAARSESTSTDDNGEEAPQDLAAEAKTEDEGDEDDHDHDEGDEDSDDHDGDEGDEDADDHDDDEGDEDADDHDDDEGDEDADDHDDDEGDEDADDHDDDEGDEDADDHDDDEGDEDDDDHDDDEGGEDDDD